MVEKVGNLILELVPAPGVGSFTLGTAAPRRLPWSYGVASGLWVAPAQVYYFADDTTQQEWGYGTYTAGRLTRDQVIWTSNNSNARVNFATLPVYLYPEIPAERMVYRDPATGRLIANYDITAATMNLGPLAGHRNRLINAGFQVNQRNYAGAATAAGLYMHDRWKAGAGGCTYSITASPFNTITISAGTLQQVIDASQIEGGTYTLGWQGTSVARVDSGAYAASPLTVTGLAPGVSHTVEFNTGTVLKPQFETGDVASQFEIRHDEQAMCDRYYSSGNFNYQGWNGGSNPMVFTISLPQKMRANPTLTLNVTTITNLSGPTLTALNSRDLALAVFGVAANPFTLFGTYTATAEL